MTNTVGCKTIINFFQEVSISYGNSTEKNLSSALKIASCFALIAALYVGFRYVSSLVDRASQDNVDKQLEEFFKSSEKAQKCFFINQLKVWIIYNPRGETIDVGGDKTDHHLIVVSHKQLPDVVLRIIQNKTPTTGSHRWGKDLFASLCFVGACPNSQNLAGHDMFEKSIDEQLEELFKSKEKAQKCFFIDNPELEITNIKVGIIYNPRGDPIDMGNGKTEPYHVCICIASHTLPPYEVTAFISKKVPQRAINVLGYRLGNDAFLGFD